MNNVLKSRAFDRRLLFQRRPTTCRFEPTLRGPGVALRQTAAGTRQKPSLYFTLGRRRFMSLFTTGRHRVKKPSVRLAWQRLFRPAALPLRGDPLRPDCAAQSFLIAANDRRPLLSMAVLNVLISISYLFIWPACVCVGRAASVSIKVAQYKAAPAVIS